VETAVSGAAHDCVHTVLWGLTFAQLRWIFTSFTDDQLTATGQGGYREQSVYRYTTST